jgi:hypothetical protein
MPRTDAVRKSEQDACPFPAPCSSIFLLFNNLDLSSINMRCTLELILRRQKKRQLFQKIQARRSIPPLTRSVKKVVRCRLRISRKINSLECVGRCGRAIAFDRPRGDDRSSRLFHLAERQEISVCLESSFLPKFSLGSFQSIVCFSVFAFRNRPHTCILVPPKWSAQVNQESFQRCQVS